MSGYIAPRLATEVSGRIECIAEDYLRLVIQSVQRAACLTAHDLDRSLREDQRRCGKR